MKITIAAVFLMITLLGARVTAADSASSPISVEQQFQQADIQLAIEQYKTIRRAAFDLAFRAETEIALSEEQRKQLKSMHSVLQERAEELRAMTIKNAAIAVANAR
jgi:hypothetical protein